MNMPFVAPETDAAPTKLKTRLREESDGYPGIVAVLTNRWRVIVCRDGLQWILQRRKAVAGDPIWQGRSYCTTRVALLRCVVENVIGVPAAAGDAQQLARLHGTLCDHAREFEPGALDTLLDLPERIGHGR
jgi:hypothetical protein